ncbi:MAG TPA: hypothetical protein PKJ63_01400 [Cyclobacteriaceae bacterium]|nr:hypothetical protein [Cyclobacteriaceae bacterium]
MSELKNPSRGDLLRAVKLIKSWRDRTEESRSASFQEYYDNAPEMESIRNILGSYDEMKDEVFEARSIPVKN